MSGKRSNPWLADHVIFFSYRWLSWLVTVALLLATGSLATYAFVLVATGLINVLATILAQRYVRIIQHNALVMGIDIIVTIAIVLMVGGWNSPLTFYAYSSLVLPGLLFGWRGGVIAGLDFVALYAATLWSVGQSPADFVAEYGLEDLLWRMIGPVVFGALLPTFVEFLRIADSRRKRSRTQTSHVPRLQRDIGNEPVRFNESPRSTIRSRPVLPNTAPLAVQATKIRATEQSVEELRRIIFAPLPSPNMDLGAAIDVLALRFDHHTHTPARVSILGRTRMINPIHRGLLVRLTQESLLNIQQHAHAATAMLTIRYDTNSIAIMIQDDGVGLLDGTHERPGLHALRAMQYRLAEFSGRLDVFETEGGGVTVRATIPLE